MNQEKQIKAILADLYAIDSSFRNYEKELRKTILKILAAKPEVKFDERFKEELRLELLARIEELKAEKPVKVFRMPDFSNLFAAPKFAYALSGAIVCLLVLVPVLYFSNKAGYFLTQPESKLVSNISTTRTTDNAWGLLSTQETFDEAGKGGGGDLSAAPVPMAEGEMMIARQDYVNYRYVYRGDEIILDEAQVEVWRRKKGEQARLGITHLLSNMDFGVFDLSTFKDVQLERIELSQDKELGYSIHISFYEGMVSINRNYRKWEPLMMEHSSLNLSDIPDDARLLEVADNFIREHKINMANYGQPVINRYWERQSVPEGVFEEMAYIPQEVSITYPLVINGSKVYEQGGNLFGLTVSVRIPEMKVGGLYNLCSQNYETSMYEAETDAEEILKVAEQGGSNYWYPYYEGQTVEVELGTPERIYMRFMTYNQFESNELLVPALLFPITEGAEKVYRQNVIVPLAKELLEVNEDIPVPRPMPAPATQSGQSEPMPVSETETAVVPEDE